MKIEIIQNDSREHLFEYESDLIPQIGDWYAASNFQDKNQRTIVHRLIVPNAPNYLNIYVDYTYPILIVKKEEKTVYELDKTAVQIAEELYPDINDAHSSLINNPS